MGRRQQQHRADAHPHHEKSDLAIIYHTGDVRACIGIGEIVSESHPDKKLDDLKRAVMTIKAKQKLKRPVTLAEIKADPAFAGFDLIRIGRLSVVPVPEKMWKRIEQLSKTAEPK